MATCGHGNKLSTLEQRLDWLRKHPEVHQHVRLVPLQGGVYRYFVEKHHHVRIANAMKAAGLFAPTTYAMDIPIGRLIRILRGLR